MSDYDLLVVGGGVNGVGVARDAAGRGLSVLLCEKDDLAQHTSSWSTKLIHGGLRYLEQYEFRLVREALIEREVLLEAAPHLVRPLRFILPHHKGLRPRFVLRLGLWLYDRLGGRKVLPATTTIDLARDPRGAPLTDAYAFGFEYTDCAVDDSRLVAVNAVDARRRGATVLTRTEVIGGRRDGARWRCAIRDEAGVERRVTARAIVNAAGPWVSGLFDRIDGPEPKKRLRLVKGSHIVTRRLYDHDRAYIFQNSDGRVVFAIPWTGDTTLLGTTDEAFEGEPAAAAISEAEIA
ncbi:MAG: glycerol-3-phosphate dehydrogenase, partial [Pseudomonadota bacterium]